MLAPLEDYIFLSDPDGVKIFLVERTGEIFEQSLYAEPAYRRRTQKQRAVFNWRNELSGPCRWQWRKGFLPVLEIVSQEHLLELTVFEGHLLIRKDQQQFIAFPLCSNGSELFGKALEKIEKKWEDFFRISAVPPQLPGHDPNAWKSCFVQALSVFRYRHPRYGVGCYNYSIHDGFPPTVISMTDALLECGHTQKAFEILDYFLERFITPEGLIDYYGPSLAEYGMILDLCGRLTNLPEAAELLLKHRRTLEKMGHYLIALRNPWRNGSGNMEMRLLKGSPEADTRNENLIWPHNNAWILNGFRALSRIARQLGCREWAAETAAEAEDLQEQLRQTLDRYKTVDGVVPYVIRDNFELKNFQSSMETTYANYRYYPELLASGILSREEALKIIEARETMQGELEGMTFFNYKVCLPDDPVAPDYACDNWPILCYGRALAQLGEKDRLLKVIEGHYRYHQTQDTFTAYEIVDADLPLRRAVTDWCVPAQLAYPGLLTAYGKIR
jgi:hypothetical protein